MNQPTERVDVSAAAPRRIGLWLRLAVTLGLLWWLSRTSAWAQVWQAVRHCRWEPCLLALVLLGLVRVVTAYKWRLLLAAQGGVYPFGVLLQSVWTSNFFGYFLPTTAGADGVRVFSFSRLSGRPLETTTSILMKRLTGAASQVLLALFGAMWSEMVWGRWEIVRVVSAPIAVMLLLTAAVWHPAVARSGRWLFERIRHIPGLALCWRLYASVHAYRYHLTTVLGAMVLSVGIHVLRVLTVFFTAKALGMPLAFLACLVIVPAVLLVSMLPISIGAWGVQEGSFVFLMKLAGLGAGEALGLALVWRTLTLLADVPGLMFFVAWRAGRTRWRIDPARVVGRPLPLREIGKESQESQW